MENLPIDTKSLSSRIFYSQEEDKVYVGEPGDYKEVGSSEFDKQRDRKAFAQIGDVEDFYTTITRYDAGATQTFKHVNGVLTWVTD